MSASSDPASLIAKLDLQPHPEGGWYKETWSTPSPQGTRPAATGIHFLLEAGQRSHWHCVHDAEELWLWHAGSPLVLAQASAAQGPVSEAILGPDVLAGHAPQILVPTGHWQAAAPQGSQGPGWTLVSCVVSPGFQFSSFELAPPHWHPGAGSPP